MADSIIEKIRKAAEARDKAITEEACGEPLAECLCESYYEMGLEELEGDEE